MLSGVELSEVFAVSPKRSAGNATLEALARAFVKPRPRRRKNVAWDEAGDTPAWVRGAMRGSRRGRSPAQGGPGLGPSNQPTQAQRQLDLSGPPLGDSESV